MLVVPALTGLGVADLHKRTEALPRLPSISVNEVEAAQVGSLEQHLQDVRGEEEIAAAAPSEGLLLLPPQLQLQEMQIWECQNLVLCLGLLDGDKDPGRTGGVGLQGLRSLRSLQISYCPRFLCSYSSSSSCFPFPDSLEYLASYWGAVGAATLLPLSNLTSHRFNHLGMWGFKKRGTAASPRPRSSHQFDRSRNPKFLRWFRALTAA